MCSDGGGLRVSAKSARMGKDSLGGKWGNLGQMGRGDKSLNIFNYIIHIDISQSNIDVKCWYL